MTGTGLKACSASVLTSAVLGLKDGDEERNWVRGVSPEAYKTLKMKGQTLLEKVYPRQFWIKMEGPHFCHFTTIILMFFSSLFFFEDLYHRYMGHALF